MCETVKQFVLGCIEQARGDDLCRAELAFQNCTPEEMAGKYGESGKTRQQIVDGYKAHSQKCDAAIESVRRLM